MSKKREKEQGKGTISMPLVNPNAAGNQIILSNASARPNNFTIFENSELA
jgi:hypothetical protein